MNNVCGECKKDLFVDFEKKRKHIVDDVKDY
jgi:hypothetical protein